MRQIIMEAKNQELVENRDKKDRECNIIIHGKINASSKQEDDLFVSRFMESIEASSKVIKLAVRVGRSDIKKRPIKLVCHNVEHKENIMNNLWKLKNKEEFRGISITDDYTILERNTIREYKKSAKEMNEMEPNDTTWTWKVRGNPRIGLVLKKFPKIELKVTTTNL